MNAVGRRSFVSLWACLIALLLSTTGLGQEMNPREMPLSSAHVRPPEAERLTLGNGMVIYLLEDHASPWSLCL